MSVDGFDEDNDGKDREGTFKLGKVTRYESVGVVGER